MSHLAETAADLATWLAEHTHPELPPVSAVHLRSDFGKFTAELQLPTGYGGARLADLADWAEHLNTEVTVKPGHTVSYIRAEITTSLQHGQPLALWNHLEGHDRVALEASGVLDALEPTICVAAADLRQAVEKQVA